MRSWRKTIVLCFYSHRLLMFTKSAGQRKSRVQNMQNMQDLTRLRKFYISASLK